MNDITPNENDCPDEEEMPDDLVYDGDSMTIEEIKADLISAGMDPEEIAAKGVEMLRRLRRERPECFGMPGTGGEGGEPPDAPKPPA